ncbi:MAG: immune inhibitor A, partial [Muribaculaceae bacterium]|nr:immune inhibitor A [Muribaculaceae bacterium]
MRILTLTAGLLLGTATLLAVPAKPGPITFTQPDGTEITVVLRGDERHHWYQSVDGYPLVLEDNALFYGQTDGRGTLRASRFRATDVARRGADVNAFLSTVNKGSLIEALNRERLQSPRLLSETSLKQRHSAKARPKAAGTKPTVDDVYGKGLFDGEHYPVFGEQKGLVILVEYTDVKFNNPAVTYGGDVNAYYTEMLNGDNFTKHNATGSARRWFIDNSNGQFLPTFDVYGPVELSHNMAYYGGNDFFGDDQHPELMAVEACQQLDGEVDFSEYDRDGDGYIDNVYIIYAGRGEASGGAADTVWP